MLKHVNQLATTLLHQRSWAIGTFQASLIFFSLLLAWMLRFDFHLPQRSILLTAAPVLIVIRLVVIAHCNLSHGWWRYTGVSDALDVARAVSLGSALFFLINRYGLGLTSFPISVYLLEALLTGTSLAGVRLLSRVIAESVLEDSNSVRVLIVGAGTAAQMLIREIKQPRSGYAAVGCVDDDPSKRKLKIHGIPVLGAVDELPRLVVQQAVEEILIAVPSASSTQMRRFVEICERSGARFRTVPSLRDLISGELTMKQVREVKLEDLLGREPVTIDLASVRNHLAEKVVMVTGAAGSIGSELCRQIVEYGPSKLICVDHSETGIFYLERELSRRPLGSSAHYVVADIRNTERMTKLLWEAHVEIIFHAAAYKHVPVMESNVPEAVMNNVFGLVQLLELAEEADCKTFVAISSDKAVKPTSIMGCTKRLGELILAAWPSPAMRCVSVRFGNVLGSSGSVIPVFTEQLRNGQPLTITDPEIKRFFMTIREAVSLVLQAFVIGKHREILVLDMGEPVRILDLAHTLIRLSGKHVGEVPLSFTGLRPGEKLYEDLFYDDETVLQTVCEKIKRTQGSVMEWKELKRHLEDLQSTLFVDGARPIKKKLKEIVPQYYENWSGDTPPDLASADLGLSVNTSERNGNRSPAQNT